MSYQTLTISAAAGGTPGSQVLRADGRFFQCLYASGPLRLQMDNQAALTIATGKAIEGEFSRFTLLNDGAASVTAVIYSGPFKLNDSPPPGLVTTDNVNLLNYTAGTPLSIPGTLTKSGQLYRRRSCRIVHISPAQQYVFVYAGGNGAFGGWANTAGPLLIGPNGDPSPYDPTNFVNEVTLDTDDVIFSYASNPLAGTHIRVVQHWFLV